jgi:hypothetical protein
MNNRGNKRISIPDRFSIASDVIHSEDEVSRLAFWHSVEKTVEKQCRSIVYKRRGSNVMKVGGTIDRTACLDSNSHGTFFTT